MLNRILLANFFKLYFPMRISTNFLSSTLKPSAKKRLNVKNNFKFQTEFQHNLTDAIYTERKVVSAGVLNRKQNEWEQDQWEQEYGDLNVPGHRTISSDLLPAGKKSSQRENKLHREDKISKPSLKYQGEILFGVHPVYLALLQKKRIFHHLFTRKDIDSSNEECVSRKVEIIRLAKSMDIPVSFVDNKGLKILAPHVVHQGVCLDAGYLPLPTWNEAQCENDVPERNPLWLVLDEILDPMNVGAIIRSAYYFGVNKLFTVRGNSCKLSPTVSKASSGSLEVMDIHQIDNLEDFIKRRKDNGWCIVSTLAYAENTPQFYEPPVSISEFGISKPTILILGNEGKGISEAVLKLCDSLVSIEPGQTLPEGIDSLNVSVAAGVLLYVLNSKNVKR